MNSLIRTALATAALCAATCAATAASAAAGVVWDQGPSTGVVTGTFINETDGQNFADAVRFDTDTVVTGLNFFTGENLDAHSGAGAFHIKFLADAAGAPGDLLMATDVGFTSSALDMAPYVNEYRFAFAPITLRAGTNYWVGVSGNGFDAGQAALSAPRDGQMAQFAGGVLAIRIGAGGRSDVPAHVGRSRAANLRIAAGRLVAGRERHAPAECVESVIANR